VTATTAAPSVTGQVGGGAAVTTPPRRELPRGGRVLFPAYRLVGFCGAPGSPALGRLGIGNLDARVAESERLGATYAVGRPVLPVVELIAVVAQRYAGADGRYRVRVDDAVIETYLDAARRHRALLLLNVQPGRSAFLDEARALERWLTEPDVGLALDPEWAVGPGQLPGRVYGRTTGRELDGVAGYLDGLVRAGDLPQKAMVVHQVAASVVQRIQDVRARPGVAVVRCVDGIGSPGAKRTTWRRLVAGQPRQVHAGFKLFFEEDAASGGRLMTPREVLALTPTPEYVMYE
jgi:hypothetical protein